jgi:hypothetical protein
LRLLKLLTPASFQGLLEVLGFQGRFGAEGREVDSAVAVMTMVPSPFMG